MLALEVPAISDDTMLKQFHMTSLETAPHHALGATGDRWKGYVSVIVPVFNEAAHLDELLHAIQASPVKKEIIIVDDGSTDGTRAWLQQTFAGSDAARLAERTEVKFLLHDRNRGKGAAVRTAMAACAGEVIVIQDADLEYDPADWAGMYALIAERGVADVVYGSRFHGRPHRSLYVFNRIGNWLVSTLFNLLYNQTLSDIETCYKMFTREVLQTLALSADDFGIEVQISAQIALARRWRVYETGIQYFGRTYAEGKKIGWRDGVKALWYLFRYRVAPGRGFVPVAHPPPRPSPSRGEGADSSPSPLEGEGRGGG